jgi:hypothetical protein
MLAFDCHGTTARLAASLKGNELDYAWQSLLQLLGVEIPRTTSLAVGEWNASMHLEDQFTVPR